MAIKPFHIFFCLNLISFASVKAQQPDTLLPKENLRQLFQLAKLKNNTQPAQAAILFEQAAKLSEVEKDYPTYCECLKQLAIQKMNVGNFTEAKEQIQKAFLVAEAQQLHGYKADLSYISGNIFYSQGNLPGAVQKYLDALRYYEPNNQAVGSLNSYISLAEVYARQNNFNKAIEFDLKALKLFEERKERFRQLNMYEQVGSIYHRQKNLIKAKYFYSKALLLYKELNNQAGEATTLINLANIDFDLGAYQSARNQYQRCLTIANGFNAKPIQVQSLNGMAKCDLYLKDYESANTEFRQSISIAKQSGLKIELDEAYSGLSEIYQSLNDKGKSRTFKALSTELRDSMFNDSIIKLTSDMQLLYETEKKQVQIELYKKNGELNDLELKQTRQTKNFFIALSVMLLFLVLIFIYFISQNRKINTALKKGLAELEIKNREVEDQKEKLTQLIQVKDRFFSIISHDLRNNLTTMKLYFDLISQNEYKSDEHSGLSKQVASTVQNTIDLFENLLVWASAQIKDIPINPVKISIYGLAQENCHLLSSMAYHKQIQLNNHVDEDAMVFADVNMVNLILRNLLSNALKFTPERGSVNIITEDEENELKISVIDNGVGIKMDKLDSLFTAHANNSTKGTANEKGTGLGLMLCKEFVEKNGGRIWVESDEGKGSSFCFTLPKAG